ncbi:MAG: flagellar protein FliS [Archangiaceae bacterium]|nr:flagellar protein FliS [Archangiaceae bacterium]
MYPAIHSYRQVQAETASKERTLVLLFEAALRFIQSGAVSLEKGAGAQAAQQLSKASDIVIELWNTLDRSRAPELCDTLERVYEFCAIELSKALTSRQAVHARNAERAFAPLVDAFRQAVAKVAAP